MKYSTKLIRNFRKISSIFFLQLNINDTKTVNHEYSPSKELKKSYRIFKVLTKFNEKERKKLCRFIIKICNYYF